MLSRRFAPSVHWKLNMLIIFSFRVPSLGKMQVLDWWGIKSVLHTDCAWFIRQWNGLMVGRRRKKWRLVILSCVISSLWFERNKVKFEGSTPNILQFANTLKYRIVIGTKELLGDSTFSFLDVV